MSRIKKQKPKSRKQAKRPVQKKSSSFGNQVEAVSVQISQTTDYVNKFMKALILNVTDMISFNAAKKSIVFANLYPDPVIEDFPSIKISPNYIQSYKEVLNHLNQGIISYCNYTQYLIGGSKIDHSFSDLKTSDFPEKNMWFILNFHSEVDKRLILEGINPELNGIGAYLANLRIKEDMAVLQLFKFLPKMGSWYQCPYVYELPLTFIEDFIAFKPLDLQLNVLFEDMDLPSDEDLIDEITDLLRLLIYQLQVVKSLTEPVILPVTTVTTPPKRMKEFYEQKSYRYYILQNIE